MSNPMTPGDLYERAVALGLCERANYGGRPVSFKDSFGGVPITWQCEQEIEDICAMTVLRSLEKRGLLSTYARVHKLDLKLLADFLIRHAETD